MGFERYSQFPAKVALQLMRSTWGNPFQTCRGGGKRKLEIQDKCAPNPSYNPNKEIPGGLVLQL